MAEQFVNSKNLSEFKEHEKVKLFDLKTGLIFDFAIDGLKRNQKLNEAHKEIGKKGICSDWWRRHYVLSDYQGTKIDKWHRRSRQKLDFMTVELFQEIQDRNPSIEQPDGKGGTERFYIWKEFLIDKSEIVEVKKATDSQSQNIKELVAEQVKEQLSELKANAIVTEDKPTKVPRAGRNKKTIK